MVTTSTPAFRRDATEAPVRMTSFYVAGGIFKKPVRLQFPAPSSSTIPAPLVLILSGKNGSGKTTILRMISGMLEMNFDVFRNVPFEVATMELSDGSILSAKATNDREFPVLVEFGPYAVTLFKRRGEDDAYSAEHQQQVTNIRERALNVLRKVDFEFLDIHRSLALKTPEERIIASHNRAVQADLEAIYQGRAIKSCKCGSVSLRGYETI